MSFYPEKNLKPKQPAIQTWMLATAGSWQPVHLHAKSSSHWFHYIIYSLET